MAFACPNHTATKAKSPTVTTFDAGAPDDTGGETGHIPNKP